MTKRARFTQTDIARVLRAIKQEEVSMEIEVSQDGKMVIRPAADTNAVRRVDHKPQPRL